MPQSRSKKKDKPPALCAHCDKSSIPGAVVSMYTPDIQLSFKRMCIPCCIEALQIFLANYRNELDQIAKAVHAP